jgi:hypothetical protein
MRERKLRRLRRTRFIGIRGVEVVDEFLSVLKFVGGYPRCFFVGTFVPGPAN